MRLTLIRHAQSVSNAGGLTQPHHAIPLTAHGQMHLARDCRVRRRRPPVRTYFRLSLEGIKATVDLAVKLRGHGYDVLAIRPPTVPTGTARLRIALTLNVNEPAVEGLFHALGREMVGR